MQKFLKRKEKLKKLFNKKSQYLVLKGIINSSRAFVGPEVLHVDLTNHCNFNCVACWCRSPLLGEKTMPDWEKKLTLPLGLLKSVFDDLGQMGGLKQVKLVGGGEPFMHPGIMELAQYIKGKDKDIEIDINTNFSLVNEDVIRKIFDIGIDSLTVSIWAGTAKAYVATHPNQTEKTFNRIKEMLKLVKERKKSLKLARPRIIIHDVVMNLNYDDVENMLDFALETGADSVQLVPIDPVKGKTDNLVLDDGQRNELHEKLQALKKKYDPVTLRYRGDSGSFVLLPDFDNFIKRTQKLDVRTGAYDEEIVEDIPCYIGWLFARIMATGDVVPCCKGHRMHMGNIYKNTFKDIWNSSVYNKFRHNGITLRKSNPYFSRIGNDAVATTGCYNCDNLWQNIPIHNKVKSLRKMQPRRPKFLSFLTRRLFDHDK